MHLFKSQHNSSTIVELAQISHNLPEKNKMKAWTSKEKKRPHLDFGCHFSKIKAHTTILRTFSQIFPKFPQILPDFKWFCPDFHQIKSFWGAVAPPASLPPTPVTLTKPLKLTEPHYTFCGTPVEKHWPTFSGALVNTTILSLLLKSFAGKKHFSRGVLANTVRFLRFSP